MPHPMENPALSGKYRMVATADAACMPAPEAVPCWVSDDDDWLQDVVEIIEKNAKVTIHVTSWNWLGRLFITYNSSLFSRIAIAGSHAVITNSSMNANPLPSQMHGR